MLLFRGPVAGAGNDPKRFSKLKTVFFEDFNEKELDRSKWNVIVPNWTVNNEQEAYVDDPRAMRIVHGREAEGASHGALLIQAVYDKGHQTKAGKTFDFLSGRMDTRGKEEFTYGRFTARIKMTPGAGLWPAFWSLGDGKWPDTGEIDIMENVGVATWTSQALHGPGYFGNTPIVNHSTLDPDISAWHVYGVDWKPDSLVFRIDGKVVYTVTKEMVEKYGRWAFDNPKHIILNMAIGGGYPQNVDHVTSPYPGLPQSTVDLIKDGKAKMLVDWVKVESW
jgi:hypothetical protein